MKLIPELYCNDLIHTKNFYLEILGFEISYQRLEEQFIRFTLDGNDLMMVSIHAEGRHWITAELEMPFGRGINFQWEVSNLDTMYKRIQQHALDQIFMDMETQTYQKESGAIIQKQFIVQDPDGYLFRFCSIKPKKI